MDFVNCSLNILKTYQALSRHFESYPEDKDRYPNFHQDPKPLLVRGSDGPLQGDLHYAQYFHGRDGLGEITERHPELNCNQEGHSELHLTDRSSVDVTIDLLASHPHRSITYICLGPLTNLARILQKSGNLFRQKIGRVVCMGGALDVPGNTSPCAEFNFFADPYAVKELLLGSTPGIPLDRFILLPLDITTPHLLPFPVYKDEVDPGFCEAITGHRAAPLTYFTSAFLERTRAVMLQYGTDEMELHDIVAVWCAIENPPTVESEGIPNLCAGWNGRFRQFDIERTGELTRGMLVVDRREDASAYAPGANRAQVQEEIDKRGLLHGPWESTALPAQVEVMNPPTDTPTPGIFCINSTPGPDRILKLLLQRVWGVKTLQLEST